nr:alanine racemase [Actinomycetota bacterium]
MRTLAPNPTRFRPTVAVVDLDAIRSNVRELKPEDAELMAVVKANGYGHGAMPVARAALQAGATWLGVALVEEGLALREAGIDAPTLVLTEFPPGSEEAALRADLTPTIYSEAGLSRLAGAADAAAGNPGVHVKVDTGMHRVGLPPDRAIELVGRLAAAGLGLQGLWTHFAKSEEVGDDFTARQLRTFRRTVEE